MTNRRADAKSFGDDFQINAGIVLMIEHIKDANSIRMESDKEDIEIELKNNHSILAQAKSVVKASTDLNNVSSNLKKALLSLSEGACKCTAGKLIYITNSHFPFGKKIKLFSPNGVCYDFNTLPSTVQKKINKYTSTYSNFQSNIFFVQLLPFESDDDDKCYEVVYKKIKDFITQLKLSPYRLYRDYYSFLHLYLFRNSKKSDVKIKISKAQFIWPLIVFETDIEKYENTPPHLINNSLYYEILNNYAEIINEYSNKFEIVTQVLSDFNNVGNTNIDDFIKTNWNNYCKTFGTSNLDSILEENLVKAILSSIIQRKATIESIKQSVNL